MRKPRHMLHRWQRRLKKRLADQRGATMLEWALLLAVVALPSYFIITLALNVLVGYYQMSTVWNGMPFP